MKSKYVIYCLYTYCVLSANSKFNFEVLFDFIKIIKYLKHFMQNSFLKKIKKITNKYIRN